MSTHNIHIHREIRKILCGYLLLSVALLVFPDKAFFFQPKVWIFFLFLQKNICCCTHMNCLWFKKACNYNQSDGRVYNCLNLYLIVQPLCASVIVRTSDKSYA